MRANLTVAEFLSSYGIDYRDASREVGMTEFYKIFVEENDWISNEESREFFKHAKSPNAERSVVMATDLYNALAPKERAVIDTLLTEASRTCEGHGRALWLLFDRLIVDPEDATVPQAKLKKALESEYGQVLAPRDLTLILNTLNVNRDGRILVAALQNFILRYATDQKIARELLYKYLGARADEEGTSTREFFAEAGVTGESFTSEDEFIGGMIRRCPDFEQTVFEMFFDDL